ncbi:MAG: phosphoribosylanthranilate isomerase [Okeania sp. SIO2H7]|nr:phosphoribosylanthranilate isomerase [Okeania sp. SIO2H7]
MRVKICGIRKPEQGRVIAQLGATALGFICVPSSPRYVAPEQIKAVADCLPPQVDRIGVFATTTIEVICQTVGETKLTGVQLHGDERPEYCDRLRHLLPQIEIIKALRIKSREDLEKANNYGDSVDTLLLDAYHPGQLGGTGQTLDWQLLKEFIPEKPWLLAGGLNPDNVREAIEQVRSIVSGNTANNFSGIDLSSGVEIAPGDKDLQKVALLFEKLLIANC